MEKKELVLGSYSYKNPKLKRVAGAAVAGIAAYQWLKMSFSGDV